MVQVFYQDENLCRKKSKFFYSENKINIIVHRSVINRALSLLLSEKVSPNTKSMREKSSNQTLFYRSRDFRQMNTKRFGAAQLRLYAVRHVQNCSDQRTAKKPFSA